MQQHAPTLKLISSSEKRNGSVLRVEEVEEGALRSAETSVKFHKQLIPDDSNFLTYLILADTCMHDLRQYQPLLLQHAVCLLMLPY